MGGWGWDDEPLTPDGLRLIENARRLYDRIAEVTADAIANPSFAFSSALILEFHAIATAGDPDPEKPPGCFRVKDNVIAARGGVVVHQPPPTEMVGSLIQDMTAEISRRWNVISPLNAAAYALWRLNWIHPFPDGNGKTARAVMYTILCIGYGRMLPGETALPDLISQMPRRYWTALERADAACSRGQDDVSDVEALILDLIERVLPDDKSDRC